MAFKVELTRSSGEDEILILDANMARNEGTKTVFYKDGSVVRMIPTESVNDLYVISDEEANFPEKPLETQPEDAGQAEQPEEAEEAEEVQAN